MVEFVKNIDYTNFLSRENLKKLYVQDQKTTKRSPKNKRKNGGDDELVVYVFCSLDKCFQF